MANQITDNRTLIDSADTVTGYVDLGGGAAGTLDTEIFIQGTGSVAQYLGSSIDGILYDFGAATNVANNVFYIRVNCGIVGLLATKAAGGFRIRFTGATVTDWFEVYVGGSDSWPATISGGWATFVVDIEGARATAITNGWTSGTVPATTAIQRVGWAGVTGGTMPRMADNTWMDAMYRLPDGSPGVIVEGQNGGVTDWTFGDIFTQLGASSGVFVPAEAGGGFVANTPIQIGIADATTHGFSAQNALVLWADQEFAPTDLYGISIVAGAGGANITFGVKTGTGNDATGAQGVTLAAGADQVRWFLDASDPDITTANFYGCTFTHGAAFSLNNTAVETISTQFVDCTSAAVANSLFQRNAIVNPNTLDGVAFATTDDMTDIKFCTFEFTDGHAIEVTTPLTASQDSRGNLFSGFGANGTNDAAVYNNSGGSVTLNILEGGDTPTVRNGTGASTTVINAVEVIVTALDNATSAAIQNARVFVEAATGGPLPADAAVTLSRTTTTATVTHTSHGLSTGDEVTIRGTTDPNFLGVHTVTVTDANTYTYAVADTGLTSDSGTSTAVILNGTTDVSGQVADTGFAFVSNQPVRGRVRKSSASPYYRSAPVSGTITSAGFDFSAFLVLDE